MWRVKIIIICVQFKVNFTKFVSVKKIVQTISNDPITIQKRVFNAFLTYYLPTISTTTTTSSDYSFAPVYTVTKRQFHYSVTLPIEQER